jgi:pyridoxamine 5'-phosphate oxidase
MSLRGWPSFPDELPEFDAANTPEKPHELFLAWLTDASGHGLAPHAVTLSSVDAEGRPDARVVILKDVDERAWYVAFSATSPKGLQLAANPYVALTFFWPNRGRQVRVRGQAAPTAPEVCTADFRARPHASQIESFVGHQSEVLTDPAALEVATAEADRRLTADPTLVPESWTRYAVTPETVEFWQARHNRQHVRLRYRLDETRWLRERLWPKSRHHAKPATDGTCTGDVSWRHRRMHRLHASA